jgi:hypothetical protein
MRNRKLTTILAAFGLAIVLVSSGCARKVVVVKPADRVEVIPTPPSSRHVWVKGHYVWRRHDCVWMPGHYRRSQDIL